MKYVAMYRDQEGAAFSCPVTRVGNEYKLLTQHGPHEISFYIYGSDCAGGHATFRDFRLDDAPRGLRGCDYFQLLNQMYKTLPWPQKPAAPPPISQQPEDFRLHVEAGGDSFIRLQEAGARGEMEYRANRQQARQQALQTLNEPDARKVQEGRQLNNEFAALKRPRGNGAAFIIKSGE